MQSHSKMRTELNQYISSIRLDSPKNYLISGWKPILCCRAKVRNWQLGEKLNLKILKFHQRLNAVI